VPRRPADVDPVITVRRVPDDPLVLLEEAPTSHEELTA
jgi:hypothetical protein